MPRCELALAAGLQDRPHGLSIRRCRTNHWLRDPGPPGARPWLLESAYQKCLGYEMQRAGLRVETEVAVPLRYGEVTLDCGYRLDFVVEGSVVVEVKSVERLLPIHKAQVLTYLRLTGLGQALLLNFCVSVMKNGISSLVNHKSDSHRAMEG